ncbi:hypothetical protein DL98DRAFT_303058 [Cadophora sp. DSE1049]|nr:hypothetical protein DL98DRAFT_303058 [Cadophora sp. DSE1049]
MYFATAFFRGANTQPGSLWGFTVTLHRACHYGRVDDVKMLLGHHEYPMLNKNRMGRNALHIAAASAKPISSASSASMYDRRHIGLMAPFKTGSGTINGNTAMMRTSWAKPLWHLLFISERRKQ